MKILFIAHERSSVQVATSVLRTTAPDVAVTWAPRFEDGADWIFSNPDLAALILDAQLGAESCASFLNNLRKRGLTAPAIVVGGLREDVTLEGLGLGPDDCVIQHRALVRDLPAAANRVLNLGRPAVPRDDVLAQKLTEAQEAVERAERARATDAAAAADQLAERSRAFTVSLAEVIHSRDALERRLQETTATIEQERQARESEAVAATAHQTKVEARLQQEVASRAAAEQHAAIARQKLDVAQAALKAAEDRYAAESAADAVERAELEARHDAELAQLATVRDAHEQKARALVADVQQAESQRAASALVVERLMQREAELTSAMTAAAALRDGLEVRVAEANRALADATARAQQDLLATTTRRTALEACLAQETESRQAAERRLTERESELVDRIGELTTALADSASRHDALELRLAEAHRTSTQAAAHAQQEQLAAATRRTALEATLTQETDTRRVAEARLAQREHELGERLAEVTAAHDAVAEKATALQAAVQNAESMRAASALVVERLTQRESELAGSLAEADARAQFNQRAATARQADLEAKLTQEIDSRLAVEARLMQREHELGERLAGITAAHDALVEKGTALQAALHQTEGMRAASALVVERLTQRESELTGSLAEAATLRDTLDFRLAEATRAIADADARAQRDQRAAALRQTDVEAKLTQEIETRRAIETSLAQREHELGERITELTGAVIDAGSLRDALELRLAAADRALAEFSARARQTEHELGQRITDVTAARDVQVEKATALESALADAGSLRDTLELKLSSANRALADADARAQRDQRAATARQAEAEAKLSQEIDARLIVEARLAQREHELGEHVTELAGAVAGAASVRARLELELSTANRALADADARAQRDERAATTRQAEIEAKLIREIDARLVVEARLAQREHELGERITELTGSVADAASVQEQLETSLGQQLDARLAVEANLVQREQELSQRSAELTSAVAELLAAKRRHTDLEARIAREIDVRLTLDQQLADVEKRLAEEQDGFAIALSLAQTAHQDLQRRLDELERARREAAEMATRDRVEAAEQAAQVQAGLEARLDQAREDRRVLDERLAIAEMTRRDAEVRHASEIAGIVSQFGERQARLEAELTQVATARHALVIQTAAQDASLARLEHDLQLAESALHTMNERATDERLAAAERQADREARIADLVECQESLDRELTQTRSAAEAAQQLFLEEIASVTARAEEQATRLAVQIAREHADHQSRLAEVQDEAQQLEAERDGLLDSLRANQDALAAATGDIESLRGERQTLRIQADQLPQLQRQIDEARVQMHWQFDQHPLPLCRSTRDGVVTHANRAFAAMVGCSSEGAERAAAVAAQLFTSSQALPALIERSLTPGALASLESSWQRLNGGRLVVRSSALATPDSILIVVEDITPHRALQDKLGQAQRMEAVGRLASEVAVTCGNLLRDVSQDGEQWLAALDGQPALRRHGERLLSEVTRAAGFLRQFSDYGDEQVAALEPVELHTVLRDLEPVLQEVAGDDIELVLPERPAREVPPFHVDLKTERVERLLVNLASYSRARMPSGGTMRFDLAPTQVDREFIDRHPNVRQGPHVLLTVTEARGAQRLIGGAGFRQELAEAHDASSERPGVDLGALQGLVRECGGHLWMEAQPAGDMMIKIHLPLRDA